MHKRIAQLITKHGLIEHGALVVVAVSGGADSLCLLHVLASLRDSLGFSIHVAHLDHMLRGTTSAADAVFVRDTALAWGVPVSLETIDVATYAAEQRLNLHDAARRVRYDWLARLAKQLGAPSIAVAHTANDQAETVLMHLLRGAGTEGLAAMSMREHLDAPTRRRTNAPTLIRPLLTTSRAEVEAYCREHNLEPRQDATNADLVYTRNRIRQELLPLLQSFNPQIVAALGRTATISGDAEAVVQVALEEAWPALATVTTGSIIFHGATWQALQPALQRAALRRAYTQLGGKETLGWEHTEAALALAEGGVGKRMPLPGDLWLEVGYGGDMLLGMSYHSGPQLEGEAQTLVPPSRIALANDWAIECGIGTPPTHDRWCIALDPTALEMPFVIRARQTGDRIRLSGGSRSLQDVFVDAKIPRALRNQWPIFSDTYRIVWIPGVRAAEGCLAHADTPNPLWIWVIAPQRS